MTRKILYSPGFGAGWVSWHHGPQAERLFMLEYQPFIQALEQGQPLDLDQFEADFQAAFPDQSTPCTGGARDLKVATVTGLVRINEYDGSESIEEQGEYEGWL